MGRTDKNKMTVDWKATDHLAVDRRAENLGNSVRVKQQEEMEQLRNGGMDPASGFGGGR